MHLEVTHKLCHVLCLHRNRLQKNVSQDFDSLIKEIKQSLTPDFMELSFKECGNHLQYVYDVWGGHVSVLFVEWLRAMMCSLLDFMELSFKECGNHLQYVYDVWGGHVSMLFVEWLGAMMCSLWR